MTNDAANRSDGYLTDDSGSSLAVLPTTDSGLAIDAGLDHESQPLRQTLTARSITKFVVFSALGLFLFLFPIPTGDGAFTIPLGVAITWLETSVLQVGTVNLAIWLLVAICSISAVGSLVALAAKPKDGSVAARAFKTGPVYLVSRVLAAAFAWMIVLEVGPEFLVSPFTGGVMLGITAHLVAVFVFLGFAIPILTDFGVMEFFGALVAKATRKLFTLPGRAAVDLMASWFGSSVASVIITRDQHNRGFYSGRQAAVIVTNFAFVSLPFSFVIANTIGIENYFLPWYLVICAVCVLLAIITPRIWPLRSLPETYEGNGAAQPEDNTPAGMSPARWGFQLATARASRTRPQNVAKAGLRMYVDIYADLIPIILAWGTAALAIFEFTPIFQFISTPMGWYLGLFGIEGAMAFAPATLIGFLDMFLPALLLSEAALATQLILGGLAIVQVIYMTETGVSILKSKMPLNIGKLLAVFMIRTLIAIPLLTGAVWVLMRFIG